MPRVALPNGKTAEFPDGMPMDQIQATIQKQFPPTQAAPPPSTPATFDPFAGGVSGYLSGNIKRNLPEIAATAAQAVPGPTMLVPPAVAAATTYAGEKAMGSPDPGMKALRSGAEALGGSVIGKIGQAGARVVGKAFDKTSEQVVKLIEKAVPEFSGKNVSETVNRILGGQGMMSVMEDYGRTLRRLWKQEVGTEMPSGRITEPFRELMRKLSENWSAGAKKELADLDRKYFAAKNVTEWFESKPATEMVPQGLSVKTLQETFVPRRAALARSIPGIEETLRMPAESLARDIPGQGLSIGGHISRMGMPHAYVRHLPSAPRLSVEGPTPDEVNMALRALTPSTFGEIAQQIAP